MSQVADACELAKGTLYRYFVSKDDLYLAVAADGIALLAEGIDATDDETAPGAVRVDAAVRAYARFSIERPDYFAAFTFFNSGDLDFDNPTDTLKECRSHYEGVILKLAQMLMQGAMDGSLAPIDNPQATVALLSLTMTGFLTVYARRETYLKRARGDDVDFVDRFAKLVLRSLQP